jgi:hypothetical protein
VDIKLIIHLHLELRIRMSGAIPLIPPYAFMAYTGKVYLYIKIFTISLHDQKKNIRNTFHVGVAMSQ